MKRMQSKLHTIETWDICKIFLSFLADKLYIRINEIKSLAYCHGEIKA